VEEFEACDVPENMKRLLVTQQGLSRLEEKPLGGRQASSSQDLDKLACQRALTTKNQFPRSGAVGVRVQRAKFESCLPVGSRINPFATIWPKWSSYIRR